MERLFDMSAEQATIRPNSISLASKINGAWQEITCKEVWEQSQNLAAGLLTLGLHTETLDVDQQDKIALLSHNRPEWIITDLAVQQSGAILTPLYPTIGLNDFEFIMNESEVKILFIANKDLYDKFSPAFSQIPSLQFVFSFDDIPNIPNWTSLVPTQDSIALRDELNKKITTNNIATIIYTSGTTGKPKGVMLSHKNIVSNVMASKCLFHFAKPDAKALSFLPLNHIFEKMVTYIYINNSICIYYAESMETIGDNLREVKPIVFTCVPRLLEKVYEKIMAKGMELKGIKKSLFFWAVNLAKQYDNVRQGSAWYQWQLKMANKIIFSKWREALGGNVIAIVSGAAPLSEKLIRIFGGAGVPIMEGYGLTETSPVISVNHLESEGRRMGTVGPLIDGVEVKIANDGEILFKGDNVMVGYYKNPTETTNVIDKDGWLHTGDIGNFVEGKFLKITDRKKEIFKTSGGKYVAPQLVESKMRESRFIEQAMVVGPNRKFVSALIVPNFEALRSYCTENNIPVGSSNESLIQNEKIIELIQQQIDKQNEPLNHIEQVKKFVLLPEDWNVENGILTPKLSLRRKVVNERFSELIEKMYA